MLISQLIKQKSYEHIVYVLRRHPIVFLPVCLLFVVLYAVPFVVYGMVDMFVFDISADPRWFAVGVLFGAMYVLSISILFFAQFIAYYLDIWIVTNDRIIDIEQYNIFSRTIAELDLFRIQDVTSEVHGFIPSVLHYGDVEIKTASQNIDIVFHTVRHPNTIREDLIRLSHEDRKYHYAQPGTQS